MTPQTYKPIFYNFCSTPQGTKTIKPEVDKVWKPKSATHLHPDNPPLIKTQNW